MPGPDLRGTTLTDRYLLGGLIGFGGSGSVYAAQDLRLGREVAVKVIHPEYAREEEPRRRIRQEALLGAQIAHPNLTEILDLGEDIDAPGELLPFIVMPLLRGRMLRDIACETAVPWHVAVGWMRQLLAGLSALHARGVVHRDIKLDNCMLVYEGDREVLKILDLGLAKVTAGTLISRCPRSVAGQIIGTYRYISPEQAQGHQVDERTDIYAVGVVLFELLTRRPPFDGTEYEVITSHVERLPPRPSVVACDAGIPAELDAVVLRALAKRRGDRFASAGELADALAAVLDRAGLGDTGEVAAHGCAEAKAALTAWSTFDSARARRLADQAARLDRVWSALRLLLNLIPDE